MVLAPQSYKRATRLLQPTVHFRKHDLLADPFGPDWSTSAAMPLVVRADHYHATRHYYLWFFGYVAKLPYEREIPSKEPDYVLPIPSGGLGPRTLSPLSPPGSSPESEP